MGLPLGVAALARVDHLGQSRDRKSRDEDASEKLSHHDQIQLVVWHVHDLGGAVEESGESKQESRGDQNDAFADADEWDEQHGRDVCRGDQSEHESNLESRHVEVFEPASEDGLQLGIREESKSAAETSENHSSVGHERPVGDLGFTNRFLLGFSCCL